MAFAVVNYPTLSDSDLARFLRLTDEEIAAHHAR